MSSRPGDHPWNEFWRSGSGAGCLQDSQAKPLAAFWQDFLGRCFSSHFANAIQCRLVDLAAGQGAVIGHAHAIAASLRQPLAAVAVDASLGALKGLQARLPAAVVAADVTRVPFADHSFDLVVSQFGLEYGGLPAFEEAARLVAARGTLGAVIHLKDGAIHRENVASLEAIEVVRRVALFPVAKEYFLTEVQLRRGTGAARAFREVQGRLAAALERVSRVVAQEGEAVAGGTIHRMYSDVVHMSRNPSAFDTAEVVEWLERMSAEADAYAGRMSSMLSATIDDAALGLIQSRLTAQGLKLRSANRIAQNKRGFMAWAVVFER
jgi:hypothetical protein